MPPPHTTPNTPPDRSHILTEARNPRSANLHTLTIAQCVSLIADEDRAVPLAVSRAAVAITRFIEAIEPGFTAGGRLVYIGAGTSGRLGVLDATEAPPTFCVEPGRIIGLIAGGDAALRRSSEGLEDDPHGAVPELESLGLTARDAMLGIAAGGTTPYVLGALAWAASRAASAPITGLLTCALIPPPPGTDHVIVLETGPEVLTGSTRMKAGSATKMTLNIISTTLMIRSGRVHENLMVDVRARSDKLRDRAARIVATLTGLQRDDALRAVDDAGGSAKTAIVMCRLGLTREAAEARLAASSGRLDKALGEA